MAVADRARCVVETRVTTKLQTQLPAELREKHNLLPGDVIVWEEDGHGGIAVRFRHRGPRPVPWG